MVTNVYEQYFEARHTASGADRHAVLVMLTADSEAGRIKYEAAASFFPHNDPEDYAVSYDDLFSKILFEGKGRRSKKREAAFMESFREEIDRLVSEADAEVFWERPLREARLG